jgi:hypothetical protein
MENIFPHMQNVFVARIGEKRKLIDYWWESQRERDH